MVYRNLKLICIRSLERSQKILTEPTQNFFFYAFEHKQKSDGIFKNHAQRNTPTAGTLQNLICTWNN